MLRDPLVLALVAGIVSTALLVIVGFGTVRPVVLLGAALAASIIVYEAILLTGVELAGGVNSQTALRVSAAINGLFTVSLTAIVLVRYGAHFTRLDLFLSIYFVLWNTIASIHGALRGNATVYVLGDWYNTLQVFLVFFSVSRLIAGRLDQLVAVWLLYVVIALCRDLRYFVEYVMMISDGEFRRILGPGNYLLSMVSVALLVTSGSRLSAWQRLLLGCSCVLSVAVVALSLYRAKWLLLIVGVTTLVAAFQWSRTARLRTVVMVSGGVALGIGLVALRGDLLYEIFRKRVVEDTLERYASGQLDLSSYQKLFEINQVVTEISTSPFALAAGFGNGSEISLTGLAGESALRRWVPRGGTLHFIHNTYFAVLHRQGGVGLLLFLSVWALLIVTGVRSFRRFRQTLERRGATDADTLVAGMALCAVTYLVLALAAFTQDFYVGVFMGYAEWGLLIATLVFAQRWFSSRHVQAERPFRHSEGTARPP